MRIENRDEAIFAVQTFLYELGLRWDWLTAVYPDGEYGDNTKEAVTQFQTRFDLPVTGEVDFNTWALLYQAYRESKDARNITPSPCLQKGDFPLEIGSRGYGVAMLRATLNALSAYYPTQSALAPTSLYQYSTASAVRGMERIYGLPETGVVDIPLWNRLFGDLASKHRVSDFYENQNRPSPMDRRR